ncbi:MAG: hypothetical protein RMJ07_02090 [Nitrososphaerota archaeon]|nr:hypothetical protein [Nitrososphaerota archaeon]
MFGGRKTYNHPYKNPKLLGKNFMPGNILFSWVVQKLSDPKKCFPKCPKFRCGKGTLQYRERESWCRWADEPCNPSRCNYATCNNRRLLPNGICGETIKRKTVETSPDEDVVQTIRVRGKTLRKIGEKEIF